MDLCFGLPTGHVRLLTVAHADGVRCCSLDSYDLATEPEYDAVSYAWGTEEPSDQLICNGCPLSSLTASLQRYPVS